MHCRLWFYAFPCPWHSLCLFMVMSLILSSVGSCGAVASRLSVKSWTVQQFLLSFDWTALREISTKKKRWGKVVKSYNSFSVRTYSTSPTDLAMSKIQQLGISAHLLVPNKEAQRTEIKVALELHFSFHYETLKLQQNCEWSMSIFFCFF